MQEEFRQKVDDIISGNNRDFSTLDVIAVNWATFALRTFTGKHLRAALDISRALVEFTNETVDKSK